MRLALLTSCALILMSGCANLNTVHRSLNLGNESKSKAVAIDGYQQPIFSQLRNRDNVGVENPDYFIVCPNPPVEAISASNLSAALTNGFKAGQSAAGAGATNDTQAALVSAVAAASIGLRTNSTTLLSYNATANCLAYMGGATRDKKFMELARRNQHITLAILAIEQLTGVAQAGQASMTTGGSSATGAENLTPLQTALDNSQKEANSAKTKQADAAADREKALKDVDEKSKTRKAAEVKQAELIKAKAEQEKLDAAAADVKDAQKAEDLARDSLSAATRNLAAAGLEVKRTDELVHNAQTTVELAQRAVRAQAASSSQVGAGAGPRASATEAVANAVVDIIKISTAAIGEGETCAAILEDFRDTQDANQIAKWQSDAGQAILAACAIERVEAAKARASVASEAAPKTAPAIKSDGTATALVTQDPQQPKADTKAKPPKAGTAPTSTTAANVFESIRKSTERMRSE